MVVTSRTWLTKAPKLMSNPELSSVIARLMLCVNDIAFAHDASERWAGETAPSRQGYQTAAGFYFTRIVLSHVNEALEVVEEITRSPTLRAAVDACDKPTREDFDYLESVLKSRERKVFMDIRNRGTFHYDRQLPAVILEEIAKLEPDRPWAYSAGHKPLDWHFELADAISGRLIITRALGAKGRKSPERTAKTAQIAQKLQEISTKFRSFATFFVRRHSK
jgi:hypothetical protein